ncbi:MAG: hemerythrin domain-containing protein [Rhabdaerophilum calidifontis]
MRLPERSPQNASAPACDVLALVSPPVALLDTPLDFILADHFRQRSLLAALRCIAETGLVGRREADALLTFLTGDYTLHHQDEELDLFPALRRRALPEDALDAALSRLLEDHRHAEPLIAKLVSALRAAETADPVRLDAGTCAAMQDFAQGEHRHLAIENGIVLALARARLTRGDLRRISQNMKARRGVAAG